MLKVIAAVALTAGLAVAQDAQETQLLFSMRNQLDGMQNDLFNTNTARKLASDTVDMIKSLETSSARIDAMVVTTGDSAEEVAILAEDLGTLYSDNMKKTAAAIAANEKAVQGLMDDYQKEVQKTVDGAALLMKGALQREHLETEKAKLADAQIAQQKAILAGATEKLTAIKSKLDDKKTGIHIWSGGPRKTHQSGGWHDFEYDREEFNTAAPYFKKESNNRMKVLIKGLYYFGYTWMAHCGHSHRHAHFYVGGKRINNNYHQYDHSWHTNWYEVTWPTKAGAQIRMQVYACNHAWHGSADINAHDRLRMEYVGDLNQEACKASGNSNACAGY